MKREVGEYSGLTYDELTVRIGDNQELLDFVNNIFDNNCDVVVFCDDVLWDIETSFGDEGEAVIATYDPSQDLPDLDMDGWSSAYAYEAYNELIGNFDYESVRLPDNKLLVVTDECDYIAIYILDQEKMVDGIVDGTCKLMRGWKKMYPHLVVSN